MIAVGKKDVHICILCGRDTVAKSQICRICQAPYPDPEQTEGVEVYGNESGYEPEGYEYEWEDTASLWDDDENDDQD